MTVTAAQLLQFRRMVAEPTDETYPASVLEGYIEAYPLMDERGELPYTYSSATPPVQEANANWIPTYDLNRAAADVWAEKAVKWIEKHDFSADGGTYQRSQVYAQMMAQVRYYRARQAAKTMTAVKHPKETTSSTFPWIGNLPESD